MTDLHVLSSEPRLELHEAIAYRVVQRVKMRQRRDALPHLGGMKCSRLTGGPAEILPEGPRMDSSFVLLQFVFSEL